MNCWSADCKLRASITSIWRCLRSTMRSSITTFWFSVFNISIYLCWGFGSSALTSSSSCSSSSSSFSSYLGFSSINFTWSFEFYSFIFSIWTTTGSSGFASGLSAWLDVDSSSLSAAGSLDVDASSSLCYFGFLTTCFCVRFGKAFFYWISSDEVTSSSFGCCTGCLEVYGFTYLGFGSSEEVASSSCLAGGCADY